MKLLKILKKILALPFLWVYGIYVAVLFLRKRAYELGVFDVHSCDIPIISIGNIALGGQGKTPLTQYIAQYFLQTHRHIHICMRGHKSQLEKKGGLLKIDPFSKKHPHLDPKIYSDEALIHYNELGDGNITLGKNRWEQLTKFLHKDDTLFPDVILMDDGFQHLSIEKKYNIVLLHTSMEQEDYKLFPWGKLRDTLSSLKEADILCFNHGHAYDEEKERKLFQFLEKNTIHKNYFNICFEFSPPSIPQDHWEKKNIIAFSGLGNNKNFLESLHHLGIYPKEFLSFPDHYSYPIEKVENILQKYPSEDHYFLTTQKDFVKVSRIFLQKNIQDRLFYLRMHVGFPREQDKATLHEVLESVTVKLS